MTEQESHWLIRHQDVVGQDLTESVCASPWQARPPPDCPRKGVTHTRQMLLFMYLLFSICYWNQLIVLVGAEGTHSQLVAAFCRRHITKT